MFPRFKKNFHLHFHLLNFPRELLSDTSSVLYWPISLLFKSLSINSYPFWHDAKKTCQRRWRSPSEIKIDISSPAAGLCNDTIYLTGIFDASQSGIRVLQVDKRTLVKRKKLETLNWSDLNIVLNNLNEYQVWSKRLSQCSLANWNCLQLIWQEDKC